MSSKTEAEKLKQLEKQISTTTLQKNKHQLQETQRLQSFWTAEEIEYARVYDPVHRIKYQTDQNAAVYTVGDQNALLESAFIRYTFESVAKKLARENFHPPVLEWRSISSLMDPTWVYYLTKTEDLDHETPKALQMQVFPLLLTHQDVIINLHVDYPFFARLISYLIPVLIFVRTQILAEIQTSPASSNSNANTLGGGAAAGSNEALPETLAYGIGSPRVLILFHNIATAETAYRICLHFCLASAGASSRNRSTKISTVLVDKPPVEPTSNLERVKEEMSAALSQIDKDGADIIFSTIDIISKWDDARIINIKRRTKCVVLEDIDCYYDDLFRIADFMCRLRPIELRQTVCVSALTNSNEIKSLCSRITSPATSTLSVLSTNGRDGYVLPNIMQRFLVVTAEEKKMKELFKLLFALKMGNKVFVDAGITYAPIVIYAKTKEKVEKLVSTLKGNSFTADFVSSELSPNMRDLAIESFIRGEVEILVCTNITFREHRQPVFRYLINYDLPDTIWTYISNAYNVNLSIDDERSGKFGVIWSFYSERDHFRSTGMVSKFRQEVLDFLLDQHTYLLPSLNHLIDVCEHNPFDLLHLLLHLHQRVRL